MIKKIISVFMVLAILSFCVLPAFADDEYISSISTFWDEALTLGNEVADFLKLPFKQAIVGTVAFIGSQGEVCPYYEDGRHRCSDSSHRTIGGVDENGSYVLLLCDHGDSYFKCYASDLQDAYNAYTADLPATSVADDGGLIWAPTFADITNDVGFVKDSSVRFKAPYVDSTFSSGSVGASISYSGTSYHCIYSNTSTSGTASTAMYGFNKDIYLTAPINGSYTMLKTCMINGSITRCYSSTAGTYVETQLSYWSPSSTPEIKSAGSSIIAKGWGYSADYLSTYIKYADFFWYMPQYKIVPTSSSSTTNYYNTGTRVGSLNLNLATTSTVNNVTTIENVYNNTQIVNETNNTIYDPTSGSTYNIADWIYDYLTRTYSGTLEDGSAFAVNYADDLVHIDLGGITLDLSYVTERETDNHTHAYVVAGRIDPTCTQDGSATYTCSVCGLGYSETMPALGHNWRLKETVPTTYTIDEATLVCPNCNGTDITYELVDGGPMYSCTCADCDNTWTVAGSTVSGYDLYECTRCGLTYKDYAGNGVDRSDSAYWAWLQWWLQNFQAWLDGKLDGLEVGGTGAQLSPIVISPHAEVQPDLDFTVEAGDGEASTMSLLGIIGKFAWVVELWNAARQLVGLISADAANAYHFKWQSRDEALIDDTVIGLDGASEPAAPTITVQLAAGSGASSWFSGSEVTVIDFSWYTQYKPTVDNLLSGILWAVFIWQVFRRAPGIIRGESMAGAAIDNISRRTGKE